MSAREFYEQIADMYDKEYYLKDNCDNVNVLNVLDSLYNCKNYKSVIELGCGNGYWLEHFSTLGIQRIKGIDFSERMLKVAQNRLKHSNSAILEKKDITAPMLENEKYDLILLAFVLSLIEPGKTGCVIDNILKFADYGSQLVIIENKQPDDGTGNVYKMTIKERWGDLRFDVDYCLYNHNYLIETLLNCGFKFEQHIDISDDIYMLVFVNGGRKDE